MRDLFICEGGTPFNFRGTGDCSSCPLGVGGLSIPPTNRRTNARSGGLLRYVRSVVNLQIGRSSVLCPYKISTPRLLSYVRIKKVVGGY